MSTINPALTAIEELAADACMGKPFDTIATLRALSDPAAVLALVRAWRPAPGTTREQRDAMAEALAALHRAVST